MRLSESVLQSITELPPFPIVFQRTLQLISDSKSSIQDIVDVIQFDQSITASILRLCNSSYFGLRREIQTLNEALVLIGLNQIVEIILTRESVGLFSGPQAKQLWRHSVGCALLSGIVSRRLNRKTTPIFFTAALLHDIGKVALIKAVPDYFGEVTNCMREDHLALTEAEKKIYGVEHAELGGRFAKSWNFPKTILDAIQYHHTPFVVSRHREIVQRVYLCDIISAVAGVGGGADRLPNETYVEVLKQYNLKDEDNDWFITQLNDRFHFVKKVLNVMEQQQDGDDLFNIFATPIS
jgi:putative nucleotidyltransferase with HDIG domain